MASFLEELKNRKGNSSHSQDSCQKKSKRKLSSSKTWNFLLCLGFLAGCSSLDLPKVALKKIIVSAQSGANKDLVTLVHFVFPKTEDLYKDLKKMDATTYFAVANQLAADFASDLEIIPIEIAPEMTVKENVCLKDFRSKAVLVFARYDGNLPGVHREELRVRESKVNISLGRAGFVVTY
ncbi:hypothetical protein AGMMS49949_08490 [Alphaproteobacteria bacterium]|nr:hypothetical protein AGMMS49949_08490 [Alphaproteobacteria bacterium]GHS99533.1 hypothetical protein AGMMS50296_7710 [Alphaproteobacteria bacterium]